MDMLQNNHTPEGLSELLADDAVMISPIVLMLCVMSEENMAQLRRKG